MKDVHDMYTENNKTLWRKIEGHLTIWSYVLSCGGCWGVGNLLTPSPPSIPQHKAPILWELDSQLWEGLVRAAFGPSLKPSPGTAGVTGHIQLSSVLPSYTLNMQQGNTILMDWNSQPQAADNGELVVSCPMCMLGTKPIPYVWGEQHSQQPRPKSELLIKLKI